MDQCVDVSTLSDSDSVKKQKKVQYFFYLVG